MSDAAADAIERFLIALGHDPHRNAALLDTGANVAAFYRDELLDGYTVDLDALFEQSIPVGRNPPLVMVRGLATHVVCPHHLTIASGTADLAYLPSDRVLGLGEVGRVVDAFAHRLSLQEDVGAAIANAFVERLGAHGAACVLELRHGCLSHHAPPGGEKKRSASVVTFAFAGTFEGDDRALALAALARGTPQRRRRKQRA